MKLRRLCLDIYNDAGDDVSIKSRKHYSVLDGCAPNSEPINRAHIQAKNLERNNRPELALDKNTKRKSVRPPQLPIEKAALAYHCRVDAHGDIHGPCTAKPLHQGNSLNDIQNDGLNTLVE